MRNFEHGDLAFFATNVMNEIYPLGVGGGWRSFGFANLRYAPPRMADLRYASPRMQGFRGRYNFGE